MARRKADPVLQKLRQLARAGRRREAAGILEDAIRQNPKHEKARDELSRYLQGKPFSFEERDYTELQAILSDFLRNPQDLGQMRRSTLKRLRHRSCFLEKALEHMLSQMDRKTLGQLRSAIARELQRRRKPLGKLSAAIVVCLSLSTLLAGGCYFLWKRAETAAQVLESAADSGVRRSDAMQLLKVHDTGLNRTFNRRIGEQSERLKRLIQLSAQHAREVDAILKTIESGKQSVVGQGVRRRALIERRLKELGLDAGELQQRWAALCRKEQAELNQQRLSLVEELMSPIPEWQGVQGNPALDVPLLQSRVKQLQQRINIYDDAAAALELPESIIEGVRKEIADCEQILSEINGVHQMLQLLPAARDYEHFQQMLSNHTPQHYLPYIEMLDVVRYMPTVASVRGMMQEHGQNLPAGLLQNARESLIDGKPSFSRNFPASGEQLHLLDELLTNSALRTRLYELTNVADNLYAYSEELPQLRYGRACFKRSALDPARDIADKKAIEWQNPHSVVSRSLDPRPLCHALGLDNKTGFASVVNLPGVITRLMQHEHPDVPPLAKAYILHYLLQVNNRFSHAMLSGLRYAPEMRRATESFEHLRRACQVKLDGNCWLQRTPCHAEAEKQFARWFRKHRKVDFAGELRKNLGELMNVTPRFCGYIDENGKPVLFEDVKEGKLIWYLSHTAMTATIWGEQLQEPMKLSPVFIMKK